MIHVHQDRDVERNQQAGADPMAGFCEESQPIGHQPPLINRATFITASGSMIRVLIAPLITPQPRRFSRMCAIVREWRLLE
jgi:hypothetical protein